MRPIPFWPSFDPWKKLTPVQVSTISARIREWRRLVVFGRLVKRGVFDKALGNDHEQGSKAKAQDGRNQQHFEYFEGLVPIHAGCATVRIHELVGHAHTNDGADHGVRTGGGQAKPPGAEVPHDSRDEQRKDHGESDTGADLNDEFDRQQRDDRKGYRACGGKHAGQVADSRQDYGDVRFEGVGIDDRGYGVCGVVESIYEFKAECDDQGQGQQNVRPDAGHGHRIEIFHNMEPDVGEGAQKGQKEDCNADSALRFGGPAVKQRCARGHHFNRRCHASH